MPITAMWSLAAVAASALGSAPYRQPDDQFRAAIQNTGMSPSILLVTIVDGVSHRRRSGCLPASHLRLMIETEHGWSEPGGRAAAQSEAIGRADRTFTFRHPRALASPDFLAMAKAEHACEITRRGSPAYMTDRTGQVREGQPRS